MENQRIIIGCKGSFKAELVSEIVALLSAKGMQTLHASNCYQGLTHFAVGTPADLSAELGQLGVHIQVAAGAPGDLASDPGAGAVDEPGVVTLEVISGQLTQLMKGQDDLADLIEAATDESAGAVTPEVVNANVLKVLALVQPAESAKKKKKGAGAEDKPGAEGQVVVEPLVPGVPEEKVPEGGWPAVAEPPQSPPPDGVDEKTGDEGAGAEGGTTTETPGGEEGAEG